MLQGHEEVPSHPAPLLHSATHSNTEAPLKTKAASESQSSNGTPRVKPHQAQGTQKGAKKNPNRVK